MKDPSRGVTALHLAASGGKLYTAPSGILIMQNMLQKDKLGWTSFHYAARYGHLDQVPKAMLTPKTIMLKAEGRTLLHIAAEEGYLHQIPEELLTTKTILMEDPKGNSTLYLAAKNGQLEYIPRELLTAENLLEEHDGIDGITALYQATMHKQLDLVLGIPLPEDAKEIVGDEWWSKNQDILKPKERLEVDTDDLDVELF